MIVKENLLDKDYKIIEVSAGTDTISRTYDISNRGNGKKLIFSCKQIDGNRETSGIGIWSLNKNTWELMPTDVNLIDGMYKYIFELPNNNDTFKVRQYIGPAWDTNGVYMKLTDFQVNEEEIPSDICLPPSIKVENNTFYIGEGNYSSIKSI